uniref:HORMA domain-containing protein n=1 Tax=Clastoptera arizonana TaxID=38151 RepID=A0A1B6C9E1_9HEMI
MTTLSQLHKNQTEVEADLWDTILHNPQKNIHHSLVFMQKLTVIALSNITYLRNIFPEDAYKTYLISGVKTKILKGNENLPIVGKLQDNIVNALEVLTKKYLKKMIFVIEDLDTEKTEAYGFNFSYNDIINCDIENDFGDAISFSQNDTPEYIKEQTHNFLKNLCHAITPKSLIRNKVQMTIRLELNEDVPEGFTLDCFSLCNEIPEIDHPERSTKTKLGKIKTLFHTFTATMNDPEMITEKENENSEVLSSTEVLYDITSSTLKSDVVHNTESQEKNSSRKNKRKVGKRLSDIMEDNDNQEIENAAPPTKKNKSLVRKLTGKGSKKKNN